MERDFVVIHAEWGRHWSGGTQQVSLLVEGLRRCGVSGYLVCQAGSMLAKREKGRVPLKTFNLRGEHDLGTWWCFAKWLGTFRESQTALQHRLLLHTHSRRGAFPTLFIGRRLKLPTILHWWVAAPIPKIMRFFADAVIAVSQAAAQQARRAGVDERRLWVIPDGVDVARFTPPPNARLKAREQMEVGETEFVAVAAGRLVPIKAYEVLLEAIALLPPDDRPLVLLAGDGPERPKLERVVEKRQLNAWVRFLGFQSDMRIVLWAADVFVHPSRSEGLGVVLLEAMAARLPVIATGVGGIPEVVREGETGLLVPPDNPESLAKAIQRLKQDEALRQQLGQRAQEWVERLHDIRYLPDRVMQVYEFLLAEGRV